MPISLYHLLDSLNLFPSNNPLLPSSLHAHLSSIANPPIPAKANHPTIVDNHLRRLKTRRNLVPALIRKTRRNIILVSRLSP